MENEGKMEVTFFSDPKTASSSSKNNGHRMILIDGCPLFREGFRDALQRSGFGIVAAESDLRDVRLDDNVEDSALMIIIAASEDPGWDIRALQSARARFPSSILVSLCQDCQPQHAAQLLRAGASAILPIPRRMEDIAEALELVALGQRVVPIGLIPLCMGEVEPDIVEPPDMATPSGTYAALDNKLVRLSAREVEILRCLLAGESNRLIARRLSIGEATVKVHVKAILRKIKVKNRTQAAIWAISNMMAPESGVRSAISERMARPIRAVAMA